MPLVYVCLAALMSKLNTTLALLPLQVGMGSRVDLGFRGFGGKGLGVCHLLYVCLTAPRNKLNTTLALLPLQVGLLGGRQQSLGG
jgi:hypothetical protein